MGRPPRRPKSPIRPTECRQIDVETGVVVVIVVVVVMVVIAVVAIVAVGKRGNTT